MLIPRGILALTNVAANEKTRYAMNGLCFERLMDGRARVLATDGKALACVTWSDESERNDFPESGVSIGPPSPHAPGASRKFFRVVPRDTLEHVHKVSKGKAHKVKPWSKLIALDETTDPADPMRLATVDDERRANVASTPAVEGFFPPCDDVMESARKLTQKAGIVIGLNVEILHRLVVSLAQAASSLGAELDEKNAIARLEMSGPDSAVIVRVGGKSVDVTGIIMPVNLGEKDWTQGEIAAWHENAARVPVPAPAPSVPACASAPEPVQTPDAPEPVASDPVKPESPNKRQGTPVHFPSVAGGDGNIQLAMCGYRVPRERITSIKGSVSCSRCLKAYARREAQLSETIKAGSAPVDVAPVMRSEDKPETCGKCASIGSNEPGPGAHAPGCPADAPASSEPTPEDMARAFAAWDA